MPDLPETKTNAFKEHYKKHLNTLDVFKQVPPEGILELESHMVEKSFLKRESIFLEDDPAEFVWFVRQGHVKEVNHAADGRDIILCVAGAGGIFGASAFAGGTYGYHSVAETDASVAAFPVLVFQAMMDRYPGLARAVLGQTSRLLRHSIVMRAYAHETAERRLIHVLVDMVDQYGRNLPLTRLEIASMAGTAVETCIRIFTRLEKAGLIASGHGNLEVRNLDGLKRRFMGQNEMIGDSK
jgi:CRP/FNR family transcriptional regulator